MNASTIVAPKAPPAALDALSGASRALNTTRMRAQAILAMLDKAGLYYLTAAESEESYALATAVEALLGEVVRETQDAITTIDAACAGQYQEVAHG